MVFVYLTDTGFRLDMLVSWRPVNAEEEREQPTAKVAYTLRIDGHPLRCWTADTFDQFAEAVRNAQAMASVSGRSFLGAKG